jgi:hypothetical protein
MLNLTMQHLESPQISRLDQARGASTQAWVSYDLPFDEANPSVPSIVVIGIHIFKQKSTLRDFTR